MNRFLKLLLVLISFLLTSCLDAFDTKEEVLSIEKDFQLVRVNNEYSIRIPKYMDNTDELNDIASLQYMNIFKEAYVIIIDESKEDFIWSFEGLEEYNDSISVIKNYKNVQYQSLKENLDVIKEYEPESTKINGLDIEIVDVDGTTDGIDAAYTIAYIEGINKIYMIMAWTLQDRRLKYSNTFRKLVKSFKLEHRSKAKKKI